LNPPCPGGPQAGYLIGKERQVDPARLTAGLAGLARKAGAEIWEQAEVRRLECRARQVRAIVTGHGPLPVASVVPAGGASCGTLLRPLGIRLLLTAGKGYSFQRRLRMLPRRPIHLGDVKVAVTPLAGGLRIAGTMEFSGNNETLRRSRGRAIARGAAQYFDGWDELEPGGSGREPEELWVRRRPLTPDGLPILDRVDPFREPLPRHRARHARRHPGAGVRQSPGRLRDIRHTSRTARALPLGVLYVEALRVAG